MKFVHDDPQFSDLLRVVADRRRLALALVEKDYWVTHVLWALLEQGLDVWFKGGTSLSKGFGLIERFSEDLDLKVEPGRQRAMPRFEGQLSMPRASRSFAQGHPQGERMAAPHPFGRGTRRWW